MESRRLNYLSLAIAMALLRGSSSFGATVFAVDCSRDAVQAAIDAAESGDTVVIPTGSATWAEPVKVLVPKQLTIQGAGQESTVITWACPVQQWTYAPFWYVVGKEESVRFTQLGFVAYSNALFGCIAIIGDNAGIRIDHCKFTIANLAGNTRGIYIGSGGARGVIDHCYFYAPEKTTAAGITCFGQTNNWHRPHTYGTTNALYVEDCVFDFVHANDSALDGYQGVHYVFRRNEVTNAMLSHHGTDSGSLRSTRSYEVYDNTFYTTNSLARVFFSRGGSGVLFNNTAVGPYGRGVVYYYYRADWKYTNQVASWGMVTGTNHLDGNFDSTGYPALDQPGRGSFPDNSSWPDVNAVSYATNDYQTLEGAYQWGNTLNGAPMVSHVQDAFLKNGTYPTPPDLIRKDRDYFDEIVKSGYSPLPYPHPLITDGLPPSPPRDLIISGPR